MSRPPAGASQRVLTYMRDFYLANDQLPPARLICDHFGWRSANAAHTHIRTLAKAGAIERNEAGKYRFSRRVN